MQQQERDLIADLFGRLQQFENQPRDSEAERLIAGYVGRQPASVYLLTQTVIVQEEALKQAKARIAELESKATETSFLGSAPKIGPWGASPAGASPGAAPASAPRAPSPWQAAPAPQQAAPYAPQAPAAGAPAGGGGFLRSALTTAAGVAGGALLFQGISSMFGHSTGQALANPAINPSSLMPPDQLPPVDLGPDMASAGNYDSTPDNSGFDDSDFDDSGFDNSSDDDI